MSINLIYGPPGTGKTTYLLNLLEDLLKRYGPDEIAYVSYTRKGSYEGRDRALERFNYAEEDFPYFRTLHSIAFRELRMSRASMISRAYYKSFSEKMGMKFTGFYTEDFRNDDDRYLFFDILHRNNPKAAKRFLYDMDTEKLRFVQHNYTRFKKHMNIFDFTDLLENYVKEGKSLPVKVAIIDEAQDLTSLQWKMIWKAFCECEDIFIAGDDDQAIYEWSGADVDYFLNLKGDTQILGKSYRLPDNILKFSEGITERIEHRVSKEYKGTGKEGRIKFLGQLDEIQLDEKQSYLFLARNNWFLKEYEEFLKARGIVYRKKGVLSIDMRDFHAIRDFVELKKTRDNKFMTSALRTRIKKNVDLNLQWYDNLDLPSEKINYYREVLRRKKNIDDIKIEVGTIHSVKGGEADNVVLLSDVTKSVYRNLENNPDSEHRVFYVGVTRTKQNLYIVNSRTKNEYIFYRRPRYE
ncbi:MAG: UvrD-helicase domain-containing protein [Candidatus Thorarchaeota archaeon]|nr:UvrD-helicase domain-containing protein [Candidatus Thorarchaeota archaeon]